MRAWLSFALALSVIAGCTASHARARAGEQGSLDALTSRVLEIREGLASYYARMLDGRLTASGVPLDLSTMVAAHPTYPFGTRVRVTNLENRQAVEVDIIDRGPAAGPRKAGVIIDLSRAAAQKLGLLEDGRAKVLVEVLKWGEGAVRAAAPRR